MGVLTVVLQVVLGLAFIGAGTSKLVGTQQMVDDFDRFGYPRWFMYFTGATEVVAALGVLAGIFVPFLAVFGGLLIAAVMVGAVSTHVRMKDPGSKIAPPVILLALSIVVVFLV